MNPYSDFSVPWFDAFLLWLSATELRAFFYRFEDFDWLFVFAHVASAAVLLGSILIVDLRIIGVMCEINLRKLAVLALPWSIGGAIIALLSGCVLLLFDPIAVGVHTHFLPKMGLILLGLLNALAFHHFTQSRGGRDAHNPRPVRWCALDRAVGRGLPVCHAQRDRADFEQQPR
ncbi:MAG: hypothetical protein IPG56_17220 [Caulobacteraceae bacterium]|nr:hypothetical protein [Caulobacteraceae bacterium]